MIFRVPARGRHRWGWPAAAGTPCRSLDSYGPRQNIVVFLEQPRQSERERMRERSKREKQCWKMKEREGYNLFVGPSIPVRASVHWKCTPSRARSSDLNPKALIDSSEAQYTPANPQGPVLLIYIFCTPFITVNTPWL